MLACVFVLSCGQEDKEISYPTAAELKHCPFGHPNLKEIPILYGLPSFAGEKGKELQRKQDNNELALGGCIVDPDSPKVEICCATCGYHYSYYGREWDRSSQDPNSFDPPISSSMRAFSPPNSKGALFNVQIGNKNCKESLILDAQISLEEALRYVSKWCADQGIVTGPAVFDGARRYQISSTDQAWLLSLYKGGDSCRTSIEHIIQRPAKAH